MGRRPSLVGWRPLRHNQGTSSIPGAPYVRSLLRVELLCSLDLEHLSDLINIKKPLYKSKGQGLNHLRDKGLQKLNLASFQPDSLAKKSSTKQHSLHLSAF